MTSSVLSDYGGRLTEEELAGDGVGAVRKRRRGQGG